MSASGQRNKLAPKALRNKDVPDYAAQVEEVAAALVAVRFSPLIFEPATYNGEGYISKVLLSLLKVFSECQSEDDVERIVSIGVRKKFFDSAHTCTPAQFYGFLKYLRSPAGADALADQNAKLKREKRALPGFTGAELCYEAMFEVQKADASKALAAVRKTYDEEVEKLETQLLLLKNERDAALVEEQTKFSPYCDYVLPDSSTFARLCWNKYKEAAEAAGTNLKRCNDANIVEAAEAFGDVVRSELLRDYIAQGEHKVQLERYIAESVAKFRATGRVRWARRLNRYLTGVDSQQVVSVPKGNEEKDGGSDSDGDNREEDEEAVFNRANLNVGGGDARQTHEAEEEEPSTPPEAGGNKRKPAEHSAKSPKNRSNRRNKRGRGRGNPGRNE
ncbi:TPA_asm: hypothetical protein [Melampyrum roseum amalgavirus 1]|nr:TPA_asm: hypothetical protein [Melampyrum roseum amalgavirus 1]